MTQREALECFVTLLGDGFDYYNDDRRRCTGEVRTCPVDECLVCSIRECPEQEPLHFHHDGCPRCDGLQVGG